MVLLEALRAQSQVRQAMLLVGAGAVAYTAYTRMVPARVNKEEEDLKKRSATGVHGRASNLDSACAKVPRAECDSACLSLFFRLAALPAVDPLKRKVAVDGEFLRRLRRLLRIVLPSWRCKEAFILALHTSFLVSRTLLSIYVAKLDGAIVKSIVDRKLRLFVLLMAKVSRHAHM